MRNGDSDKLTDLCSKFGDHVDAHNRFVDRFDRHEKSEESWRSDQGVRFDAMLTAQNENTKAISELAVAVAQQAKDSQAVIQLHKDFQTTARIGHRVTDFIIWCAKTGGVLGALGMGIHWVLNHWKA